MGVSRFLAKNIKSYEPKRELEDLAASSFSGYLIESLFGSAGVEESALLFRNGQGVGAVYEYYGPKQSVHGDAALSHVMNGFLAENGILDLMELSVQQVDLVTAFNANLKLSKPLTKGMFKSLVKDRYDPSLSLSASKVQYPTQPASKESLFKKFGLAGIDNN
jgi:hypothetical protein